MPNSAAIYRRVVAACTTVALTATAWAAPATAVAAALAPAPLPYVALGDSYAAGFGAATTSDRCGRNSAAYPALLAREAHGGITLRNAACIGATTTDVIGQASVLSAETKLVTVTAGANDLHLEQLLRSCTSRLAASGNACRDGNLAIDRKLTTVLPRTLHHMIHTIVTAAPNARVVVTGYPLPFARTGHCTTVPVTARLRARANQVVTRLNTAIAAAAARRKVRYVDVTPGFAAHGLCSRKPWLVGAEGMRDNRALHPTATGQARGYLPAVAASGLTDRA